MEKTAILVDGAFYRRRAYYLFGDKNPKARADELIEYCMRHLKSPDGSSRSSLYRIFYYDCPPLKVNVYHPLKKKPICMEKSETFSWSDAFYEALASKRKLALRMGELQEGESGYRLKAKPTKKLLRGDLTVADLKESDFELDVVQKGVDMRIGLDIASMAFKKQVTQIVLIAGDSDFVPAAKHARREGIDFILDPMWQGIRPGLNEHIDGLRSCTSSKPCPAKESLHVDFGNGSVDSQRKK